MINMSSQSTFFVVILSLLLVSCYCTTFQQQQFHHIVKSQFLEDSECRFPHLEKIRGVFPSRIHLNFVGEPLQVFLRESLINVLDSNHFVTAFLIHSIAETVELNPNVIDIPTAQKVIELATTATLRFKDKNFPKDIPAIVFWAQQYDPESGYYIASPNNLLKPLEQFNSFKEYLCHLLKQIHLEFLCDTLDNLLPFDVNPEMFRLPSDLDDTSVFFANYFKLCSIPVFNTSCELLEKQGYNFKKMRELIEKFTWKLHDSDPQSNLIDPRTYYFGHEFFQNISRPFYLPTTWLSSIEFDRKRAPFVNMPLHVNNVDVVVSSNFLFGYVSLIGLYAQKSRDIGELFSPIIESLLIDTIDFLSFTFESGKASSRPDLVFVYYPTTHAALEFLARLKYLLQKFEATDSKLLINYPVLAELKLKVDKLSYTHLTNFVLNSLTCKNSECFSNNFLGQADKHQTFRDRAFCSSLSLNTLLDIWSEAKVNQKTGEISRELKDTTPNVVILKMKFLYNFLIKNFNSEKLENAFFSGSIKGLSSLPFTLPGNYAQTLSREIVNQYEQYQGDMSRVIYGLSGKISAENYENMLKRPYFGLPPQPKFSSFNETPFPFWSSEALTRGFGLLAVTKYENTRKL
ncbi:hypothetical protein RCL1_005541 [Eukaryota sp. TZLM3-RCL]